MKTTIRNLIFAAATTLPLIACANTNDTSQNNKQINSGSYQSVMTQVTNWMNEGVNATNILVASDNDDTLTKMACPDNSYPEKCQYLGGAAWFKWQNSLLGTDSEYKVANSFGELLEISALLFSMNEMNYVEEDVRKVLQSLAKSSVKTMVATARGDENISATEQQLNDLKVTGFDNLLDYFSKQAPNLGEDKEPNPYMGCTNNRPISYRNGVMYLSGQNKGDNLKCFIHDYNQDKPAEQQITHLVFIDDTLKNVVAVEEAFKGSEFTVAPIYYTNMLKHKLEFVGDGKGLTKFQQKAVDRWNAIKAVMGEQLLEPVAGSK